MQPGWLGVWLLVGASAVIVIELALMSLWGLRLARRSRELMAALDSEQATIRQDLERLRAAMEETRRLWQPYRRVLRIFRHPLVIALMASYRRRWSAGRI